jgi:hypothetical protein
MINRLAGFLIVFLFVTGGANSRAGQTANSVKCSGAEYRQFDFFVGDWDGFEIVKPEVKIARNRVTLILDGCAVLEDYQGTDGTHGESFSIYDASRKVWHQTWLTNRGVLLMIEGGMRGDEMVLSGTDRAADGKERLVRGVWKAVPGGVRETAVRSLDGGKSWEPWFDMIFRPAGK